MRRLSSAREAARGAVLAYEAVGAPSSSPHRLVFILHGLLGSGRNWRSFARRLAGATPSLRVVLVDLRGHGHSAALGGAPHTLAAAAADVEATAAVTGAPSVVLGHSLGGKIALAYAARFAAPGSAVWALDSSPGAHAGDPHGVGAVLDVVGRLPAVLPSRAAAHRTLSTAGLSPGLVAWLTSGLVPADGGDGDAPAGPDGPVRFAFAMTTCRALFDDYRATCLWKSLESPPTGVDVRLVAAANSGAWGGEAGERVARLPAAARARVLPLPNAGHWLHVENPEGLHNLLRDHGAV